jgi:mannose-1-phosphate guanylyltransferase / mannose-6-phosphate isomerase
MKYCLMAHSLHDIGVWKVRPKWIVFLIKLNKLSSRFNLRFIHKEIKPMTNKNLNFALEVKKEIVNANIKPYLLNESQTLFHALQAFENNENKFVVVIDENGKYTGVLNEDSVRKAIVQTCSLETELKNLSGKNIPCIDMRQGFDDVCEFFRNENSLFLCIVDFNHNPINIITRDQFHSFMLENGVYSYDYDFFKLQKAHKPDHIYNRPWGFYKTIHENDFNQTKIITLFPKEEISLQKHKQREEYWTIIKGQGVMILDNHFYRVLPGDQVFIPIDVVHQIKNSSDDENLMLAEIQLGEYFGEDDIVRIRDKYKRQI